MATIPQATCSRSDDAGTVPQATYSRSDSVGTVPQATCSRSDDGDLLGTLSQRCPGVAV